MKTPSLLRFITLLLAACVMALASCEYDAPVYGTRYLTYSAPAQVTVVDVNGDAIRSGYSNWNSAYFNNRYRGNRYYGARYYGYNNLPPYYTSTSPYYYRGTVIYPPYATPQRPLSWSAGSAPYPWAF